jgi:uncharacterized protein (DUF1697 family)
MTAYVALLRAVNVGGTGALPMSDLRALCEACGFLGVRTYIASGNAVFKSDMDEAGVKESLQAALHAYAGKNVGVLVRTGADMAAVLSHNPFASAPGNRVMAIFLDNPPPPDALEAAAGRSDEAIVLGGREIYVHYPSGMARTKLRIPAARDGTARNMNTVATLAQWTA